MPHDPHRATLHLTRQTPVEGTVRLFPWVDPLPYLRDLMDSEVPPRDWTMEELVGTVEAVQYLAGLRAPGDLSESALAELALAGVFDG